MTDVDSLARAMYDASLSNPDADDAWRCWEKVRGYWIARAERVQSMLRRNEK